ncbi:MAG: cell division protein FtsQ/DivIB, partial [Wenzhouxiangellaceae bacterium]
IGVAIPLAAALLAGSLWWAAAGNDPREWPIRWLDVVGDLERVTDAQVRAAVADEAARGFFRVDVERARAAVEALPWVARATVSRRWPDALEISLIEQRAVARFNDETLISSTGERFRVAGTSGMQGLARLHGPPERAAEIFGRWRELRGMLNPIGMEIAALKLDPRGAWQLTLADGRELLLGRDQLAFRLRRFIAVHAELARLNDVRRIDLRYPNGLALIRGDRAPADARLAIREAHQGASPNHG